MSQSCKSVNSFHRFLSKAEMHQIMLTRKDLASLSNITKYLLEQLDCDAKIDAIRKIDEFAIILVPVLEDGERTFSLLREHLLMETSKIEKVLQKIRSTKTSAGKITLNSSQGLAQDVSTFVTGKHTEVLHERGIKRTSEEMDGMRSSKEARVGEYWKLLAIMFSCDIAFDSVHNVVDSMGSFKDDIEMLSLHAKTECARFEKTLFVEVANLIAKRLSGFESTSCSKHDVGKILQSKFTEFVSKLHVKIPPFEFLTSDDNAAIVSLLQNLLRNGQLDIHSSNAI